MASKKRRPKRRRDTPPTKKRRTRARKTPPPAAAPEFTELGDKFRAATSKALDLFERDPEEALSKLERIGKAGGQVLEHLHKHPDEAKRAARNAVLSGVASLLKKGF